MVRPMARSPSVPVRLFMHLSIFNRTFVLSHRQLPCDADYLVSAFSNMFFTDKLLIHLLHLLHTNSALMGL
jgi:hypothetical protein